jgi:MarR family transcriptional regulator, organic hydroperoxide resistance regulator
VPRVESTAEVAAEVAAAFPVLYRRFRATSQVLPGSDVTPRMLAVLHHLLASGPLTVGELAQHLGTGKATATELVGRLAGRGLVDRMRDERDRRRVFVWLTDDGRRRTRQHPRVLEDSLLEGAVRTMRPADRAALLRGLRALLSTEEVGSSNSREGSGST